MYVFIFDTINYRRCYIIQVIITIDKQTRVSDVGHTGASSARQWHVCK